MDVVHSPAQQSDLWRQCNVGNWWLNAVGYCINNAGSGSDRRQRGKKTVSLPRSRGKSGRANSRGLFEGTHKILDCIFLQNFYHCKFVLTWFKHCRQRKIFLGQSCVFGPLQSNHLSVFVFTVASYHFLCC